MNLMIFLLIEVSTNKKRTENCINERCALLQTFSVLFSVDTLINRRNIRFFSYHLVFNAVQDSEHSYKPLLKLHGVSQQFFSMNMSIEI